LSKSKILEKDKMIWYSIDGKPRIPLRKFFKESMKKIQNEKVGIMKYVKTHLIKTSYYFNKYRTKTMKRPIKNNKTTRKIKK
jgi:hypothetical protein